MAASAEGPQVELPSLSLDKFSDSYFKAAEDKQKKSKKKGEEDFFQKGELTDGEVPASAQSSSPFAMTA